MKVKVLHIEKKPSKYGGDMYLITFKDLDGSGDYKTYVYPRMANFVRWTEVIKNFHAGYDIKLDGLIAFKTKDGKKILDADSDFRAWRSKPKNDMAIQPSNINGGVA